MVLPPRHAVLKSLRIALIGSRGIPACYGGYETLMEELAPRLAERGHQVTVYCRSHYTPKVLREYRGVELVVLPTIRTKYLDTPVHTLVSCLHAAQRPFDVALVVNGANAPFVPLLRSAEIRVALHVDGIERRRAKWGRLGRTVYAISEWLATLVPDVLITDAQTVREYYSCKWETESSVITYGVEPRHEPPGEQMAKFGLESRRYFLYVSRFEPENNPHRVAAAYRSVPGDMPLVMVGGAPYAGAFVRSFTENADPRIIFTGPVYGRGYRELLSHCLTYIHATEVGGTHPALVEAMGYGNAVIVNDTPENREVAGDAAVYFRATESGSLAKIVRSVFQNIDILERLRLSAQQRAHQRSSWPRVADSYEDLLTELSSISR
jgi:glycosyltransferase involved in cell wall biosynthesis